MTLEVKHKFTSLKGDGSDLTQVQPSNWNDTHDMTMATGKVLGRVTAGAGSVEEIDWTAFGRSWLNAASASAAQGLLGPVSSIANQSVTYKKIQLASAAARLLGSNANPALTILGAANNGSGLIRLTVANTSTFATGQRKVVAGVVGTTEANDSWVITVVDGTHIDLQGSAFSNNYISGGTIGAGFEEISLGSRLSMSGSVLSSDTFQYLNWQEIVGGSGSGMALVAGANKRGFNTLTVNEITGASQSSNQLTLPAGTYEVDIDLFATSSTSGVLQHVAQLWNATDAAQIMQGITTVAQNGLVGLSLNGSGNVVGLQQAPGPSPSYLRGRFTLAAQKVIEIRSIVNIAASAGSAHASFSNNLYGNAIFKKLP